MDLTRKGEDYPQKELISAFDRRFKQRTLDPTREFPKNQQKKFQKSPGLECLFSGVENNKTAKDILQSVDGKRLIKKSAFW